MNKNARIVVFTGAGVSAESGLHTFRGDTGLWENYRIDEVCTHEAWLNNPQLCVEFYNARRKDTLAAQPNEAHKAIAHLQQVFPNTRVITQNIDDLHERAGSTNVLHLHGEICKLRSEDDEEAIVPIDGWEQHYGDRHPVTGAILRPHIVFFNEGVPNFPKACEIVQQADILIVVGTSLVVYPAASLVEYVPIDAPIYVVDPNKPSVATIQHKIEYIQAVATKGVKELVDRLTK